MTLVLLVFFIIIMHNTAANNNTTNSPSTPTKNPKGIEFFFTPGASLERVRERIRNKKYYGYYMTDEELDEFSGPHYPETDDPEMIQNQLGEPDYYGIPESKPQSGRIPSPHFDSSPKIPINEKVSLLQFDETQNVSTVPYINGIYHNAYQRKPSIPVAKSLGPVNANGATRTSLIKRIFVLQGLMVERGELPRSSVLSTY